MSSRPGVHAYTSGMRAPAPTRPPPEIVFVPPPPGPGMPGKRIRNIAGACVVGSLASLALFMGRGLPFSWWLLTVFSILIAVAIIVALRSWQVNTAHRAFRQTFFEKHPFDDTDPLAAALGRAWKEPDRVPKTEDVQTAWREGLNGPEPDRAYIVCFGEPETPEIGEQHFEPEIVTPTGTVRRQLIWLVVVGALVVWWMFGHFHWLPPWVPSIRPFIWGLGYFFAAGALALAVWTWKAVIRPTYLRSAPGVIQVLEYRYRKTKPIIRSYPMEAGTLAVFTRIRKHLILTLSRGADRDVLSFSRMQQPRQRIEQVWRALLSTAPTPPLSEDELLG